MNRTMGQRISAALCALLLAACGGAASPTAPAGVRVVATEFRFEPSTLALTAGTTSLTFKNAGQTLHDLTIISGPGIAPPAAQAGDHMSDKSPHHIAAEPGKEATLTLDLPAGSYGFICSVQGHKELGMQGTITVQ